ncbi:Glyoxylase, beta-lactamase superfamily II [Halomicrobium zhouii]|uniref:Glyoxylase, beta-lactamase superfamily II n=1 Tax=Halomicrobium zhouii TaxID=767519 RepID=A0A1I6LY15_9EURY|nr:MBL fold metallo-hydrolase [Halomicrobium zhouii]SFS08323.1 Glyoxylase, beta-lactamase superfamily II [Halomicrobium zhouii]
MARKLADGAWYLDLGLIPPFASNSFLVDDGDLTLVDAGLWWNEPSVRDELADAGYAVGDLDRVLITHYDLDHVGGLKRLLPEFDGPVYLGRPDYDFLNHDSHPQWAHHKGLFHRVTRRLFPLPGEMDVRPVDDGDRVGKFTVYLTPGHNPGHAVYVHDSGVAFLGDLVWEDEGALTPPFWLDSYDMRELRESIRDLAERTGPFDIAAMAHGEPIRSGGDDALLALAERL